MDPLFSIQNALLARLRMSGMAKTQGDTIAVVEDCILQAHLSMQEAFGTAQLGTYKAIVPNATPATDDDYTFYRLRRLEDKLIEKHLLWRLVQVTLISSSDLSEFLDSDSPYKDMDASSLQGKYSRLCREIAEAFSGLATLEGFSPGGTIDTADLGPACTAPFVQGLGADLSPSVCGGEARSSWHQH